MTTSFTKTGEFEPEDDGFESAVEYPSAFGITFTPKVTGIGIGIGGILIAGYLFFSQVMPIFGELSELNQQKQDKQNQVNQLTANKLDLVIMRKQEELEDKKALKEEVTKFYAQLENLDTLLLDVNNFANSNRIVMNSYVPAGDLEKLADDSLGTQAVNNVKVKTYNLDIEGTFNQIQSFIQQLERLQPLLVVQDLNTTTTEPPIYLFADNQLTIVDEPVLKTTLTVKAVLADVASAEATPPAEGETAPAQKTN